MSSDLIRDEGLRKKDFLGFNGLKKNNTIETE